MGGNMKCLIKRKKAAEAERGYIRVEKIDCEAGRNRNIDK
jgi:hypothetical protein